jgi:hypothetical protein
MRRSMVSLLAAAMIMLAAPGAALADPGAPGTTFPEQPGAPPGCDPVLTNPGTGTDGHAMASATALAIVNGLVTDACLGG